MRKYEVDHCGHCMNMKVYPSGEGRVYSECKLKEKHSRRWPVDKNFEKKHFFAKARDCEYYVLVSEGSIAPVDIIAKEIYRAVPLWRVR